MSDLAVRWSCVLVAALAAIVLLISGFVPWWGVGQSAITGWGALGGTGKVVIVAVVVTGFLPVPLLGLRFRLAAGVVSVLSGIALGAALLIVWHLGVQTAGLLSNVGVTAGAPLAVGSCLAVAGAAMSAAHGTGLFLERVRRPVAVLLLTASSCIGLLVSLFLPWAQYAQAGESGPQLPSITLTGWHAWNAAAWCLLLDAIAILLVAACARRPYRATVGALTAAGWVAAAITMLIPLRAIGVNKLPFGIERSLTGREFGFYIALGCAATVMLLGLIMTASSVDRAPSSPAGATRDEQRPPSG